MNSLYSYVIGIINEEIESRNLSINELAKQVLISPLNLNRILNGKYPPSLHVIERILVVLNLNLFITKN